MSWLQNGSSEWNMCCIEGEDVLLFPQEMKNWIPCKLIEIRFDQGRLLENPSCRHKKINLENLQDRWCIFYLLKHKTKKHLWLACVQCAVHTCVNSDMYITCENFQSKETRHQWKWVTQVIQPLRVPLLQFPQSSISRMTSRPLAEMVQFHSPASQTAIVSVQISPTFSCHA